MLDNIPGWIICKIEYEYIAACAKHPEFPENSYPIILEELGEAAQAHNDGDVDHEILELAHSVVTHIRRMEKLSREN